MIQTVIETSKPPEAQHNDVAKWIGQQVLANDHRQADVNNARCHDHQTVKYL